MAKDIVKKESQTKVMVPLTELVHNYIDCQNRIKVLEDQLAPLKDAKAFLKGEITQTLKDRGEFAARIEGATVSLSVRKTAQIIDEPMLVADLKAKGLDMYISEQVNDLFDEPKKLMAAGTEILLNGMVIQETEFISVRANVKKEARKVVTGDYKKLTNN